MTNNYVFVIYVLVSYLFMIYSDNRAHGKEAAHPDGFLGVSSFLFCLGIGDREHGEVKKCL